MFITSRKGRNTHFASFSSLKSRLTTSQLNQPQDLRREFVSVRQRYENQPEHSDPPSNTSQPPEVERGVGGEDTADLVRKHGRNRPDPQARSPGLE